MKTFLLLMSLFSTTVFAQQQIQLIDWFAGVDFVGISHSNQKFTDLMTVREF